MVFRRKRDLIIIISAVQLFFAANTTAQVSTMSNNNFIVNNNNTAPGVVQTSTPSSLLGLQFGYSGSGELISSTRNGGPNNNGLDFWTSAGFNGVTTPRMSITNDGKVGIGIVPTNSHLTVYNASVPSIMLSSENAMLRMGVATCNGCFSQTAAPGDVIVASSTLSSRHLILGAMNGNNGAIKFTTGQAGSDTEKMSINANGTVGIGTSTPNAQLSVYNLTSPAMSVFSTINSQNASLILGVATTNNTYSAIATTGDAVVGARENSSKNLILSASNPNNGAIKFTTGPSTLDAERMTINANGNIGIGIAIPVSKLQLSAGVFQISNGTDNPDYSKSGITMGDNSTYTWIQNAQAKPLALNPVQNQVSNTNYVAVGFIPGAYNVPLGYKLAVKGKIICEELKVKYAGQWSDYVFDNNYKLNTLEEVEKHIATQKHLPGVPSADEIRKEGYETGTMDATLLKKIEELTLYLIEQNKQVKALQEEVNLLKNK